MSGWFAVKRGITSHPIFKGHHERLAIWLWLLDNAVWQDTPHDIKGHTVIVKRGSVCASERRIADEVGVGYQVVRTFLARLKADHMINAEVTHGRSIITLCNYEKYQSAKPSDNAQSNATLTQRQRTKEQGNKGTSKEEAKASLSDKPTVGGPSFDKFWEVWPLGKIAKKNAAKAFKKLTPQERTLATERATAWAAQWRRDHPNSNPIHPASYLNGTRWTDETQPTLTVIHGGPREQFTADRRAAAADDAFVRVINAAAGTGYSS